MTYEELVNKMIEVNKVYHNRFMVNKKEGRLAICGLDFSFTPATYNNVPEYDTSALDFINEYGMLKNNEDCLGKELYYKHLAWSELSDKQKQSVIDLYKDKPNFIYDSSRWESLFNRNKAFLEF